MRVRYSRATGWPLALALIAVAACADEPPTSAPSTPRIPITRQELDGNVILVTTASGANVPGSLLWAVDVADGTSVIQFADGFAGDTITLDATIEAFPPVTIVGPATKGITLRAAPGVGRIIRLRHGGVLRNLTLSGATVGGPGSAISTQGPLLLEHSTVTDNHGGSAVHGHDITLVNSTVSGNSGSGAASGISIASGGILTLVNSTVAHNEGAPGIGWVTSPGGPPSVTLRNSIVAKNGSSSRNCADFIWYAHQGMNISSDSTCGVSQAMLVADPMLVELADNGGPTPTHAIPHTSPAYNNGLNCTSTTDQRYVPRDAKCDIGAFEFNDFTKVTITIDPTVRLDLTGKALLTGTIVCTRAETFRLGLELQQNQKVGKQVVDVHSASDIPISCATAPGAWSATMKLLPGEVFNAGAARGMAITFDTPEWVEPVNAAREVNIRR